MRVALLVLAGLAVAAAVAAARYTPTASYDPRAPERRPDWSAPEAVAVRLVRERQGTQMADAAVTTRAVRLTQDSGLLSSLLDDDPTVVAEIEVEVAAGGAPADVVLVRLWDYGRLTPSGLRAFGDGWKLVGVDRR